MTSISIYSSITEEIKKLMISPKNFKPSRLYIKRIKRNCGSFIYYFGKTSRDNVYEYNGSGRIWSDYIRKYGKYSVETVWVSDIYYNHEEIQFDALYFSIETDIINSPHWANCKLENGLDGGLISIETRNRISSKMRGKKHSPGTSGTRWINNGEKRSCIPIDEVTPDGWFDGYKIENGITKNGLSGVNNSVHGKIIYNNGIVSKYFFPGCQPEGWIKGRKKNSVTTR